MIRTTLPRLLFLAMVAAQSFASDAPLPTVVVSRPVPCPQRHLRLCANFNIALAHPAMQRRFESVRLERIDSAEDALPYLAVVAPSGAEVARWIGWHDWTSLSVILTRLEAIATRLLVADEALYANDVETLERLWTATVLTFGDTLRGEAFLNAMRHSESPENRELAAIFLERFRTITEKTPPCEELLERLARSGVSDRVRLEATMAIGNLLLERGMNERAVEAFSRAIVLAPDDAPSRAAAIAARDRASSTSPILGLGGPGSVIAGERSIQLRRVPEGTASVEFRLDGETHTTSKTSPFVGSVDFARLPTRHVLEVIARNRAGRVLSLAETVVNERSDAFAIELLEPRGSEFSGNVDVVASARVPFGSKVAHVAIEWNGNRIARFTKPPYRTQVTVGAGEQGILRAVLRLDDGSEVEDVRLANAPAYEAGAHLVEVPAYFEDGKLTRSAVTVKENGTVRRVEQIVPPSEAPLEIALLIDTSSSMANHILHLQEAAVQFIEANLEPRDRAMLIAFDNVPRVVVRPTNEHEQIVHSILRLLPGGDTALHDAIITALLQLQTAGTRKAIVVFSDGLDGTSQFRLRDVEEVARRSGVPIYVLAFVHDLPSFPDTLRAYSNPTIDGAAVHRARRSLMSLSRESGAKSFEMRSLEQIGSHWSEIGRDLRKQSLVIYRTDSAGEEWRSLDIDVKGGGRVRAPTGVYVTSETRR